jgi:hypothetical protein
MLSSDKFYDERLPALARPEPGHPCTSLAELPGTHNDVSLAMETKRDEAGVPATRFYRPEPGQAPRVKSCVS